MLPEDDQVILLQALSDGFSQQQIAEILGIHKASVSRRCKKIRALAKPSKDATEEGPFELPQDTDPAAMFEYLLRVLNHLLNQLVRKERTLQEGKSNEWGTLLKQILNTIAECRQLLLAGIQSVEIVRYRQEYLAFVEEVTNVIRELPEDARSQALAKLNERRAARQLLGLDQPNL